MAETSIQWTDKTWNPVRGCSLVSPGCKSCYAMKQAHRFNGPGMPYEGLTKVVNGKPVWTGEARPIPEKLTEPLSWRKPCRVFVNSMSDLFHKDVPDAFIRRVFGVMSLCGQHTFQILTKRPERMREWFANPANSLSACQAEETVFRAEPDATWTPSGKSRIHNTSAINGTHGPTVGDGNYWPLPNVWLGVSVENQAAADERIPLLLQTPAAVRFLSVEPMLGPVDLSRGLPHPFDSNDRGPDGFPADFSRVGVDWVIVGGESGPGSRPFQVEWARSVVRQCREAGVPVFVKQLGSNLVEEHGNTSFGNGFDRISLTDRKGGDMAEWSPDLRVREFPQGAGGVPR